MLIALSHSVALWGDFQEAKAKRRYISQVGELADGSRKFWALVEKGNELARQGEEGFSEDAMKEYSAYIDSYVAIYQSNAQIAESILVDDDYKEYAFYTDIKENLQEIIGFEDKVGENLSARKYFMKYFVSVYDALSNENLTQYDTKVEAGIADYDLLINGYFEVVEDLGSITPPSYMVEYHANMTAYYSELKRLFVKLKSITYQLAEMKRDPKKYSPRVWDAVYINQSENDREFDELFKSNPYAANDDYMSEFVPAAFSGKSSEQLRAEEMKYIRALGGVVEEREGWE